MQENQQTKVETTPASQRKDSSPKTKSEDSLLHKLLKMLFRRAIIIQCGLLLCISFTFLVDGGLTTFLPFVDSYHSSQSDNPWADVYRIRKINPVWAGMTWLTAITIIELNLLKKNKRTLAKFLMLIFYVSFFILLFLFLQKLGWEMSMSM